MPLEGKNEVLTDPRNEVCLIQVKNMKTEMLDEVIACMPRGKTNYHYFQGAYASRLLSMIMPQEINLHEIKKSRFNKLLEHKTVKPVLAHCGDGKLNKQTIEGIWVNPSKPFLLSISRWGSKKNWAWNQTSRPGENLVLQLNLPHEHLRNFRKWVNPDENSSLNGRWTDHPVQKQCDNKLFRETLAWARIDLDFETNEALIEEIQSDGVRYVKRWAQRYKKCACKRCRERLKYVDWFDSYAKIWSEAMLMASIWFIKNELGINRIFIHTARSGWQMKKMDKDWNAPRSLYSDLPKKFAFKQTWAAPDFLMNTKNYKQLIRKQPDIDFYQLTMDELH